jgi:hypothetical protein
LLSFFEVDVYKYHNKKVSGEAHPLCFALHIC